MRVLNRLEVTLTWGHFAQWALDLGIRLKRIAAAKIGGF